MCIRDRFSFVYQLGANAPAGETASGLSYAQFAATLGASVPTGSSSVSGSVNFVVMARTDALAVEGLQSAIARACACVEAGADMIFPEAITDLTMYKQFVDAVKAVSYTHLIYSMTHLICLAFYILYKTYDIC